jgi:starvation-inducible DNA-binding protein
MEPDDNVDEVAELARAVGVNPIGTLQEFSQYARMTEHPTHYRASREMVVDLLGDHETIIRQLREDVLITAEKYHDMGPAISSPAFLNNMRRWAGCCGRTWKNSLYSR